MQHKSFTHEILKSLAGDIYKIKVLNSDNRLMFVFLLVSIVQKPAMERLIDEKPDREIDFSQYGKIITTCYGRYPTEEARKLLKEEFGVIV